MTIQEILSRWFEFSGYDPNQHKFNLLSSEWDYHKAGDRISALLRDYEPSGALAVLYAKQVFKKAMQDTRIRLWDILDKPEELKEYQAAYADFHSPVVLEGEKAFADRLQKVVEQICGKAMLGERNLEQEKAVIADSVEAVVENLSTLHYDLYRKGGEVKSIAKYSSQIHVFPTLVQCVLSLDKAEDGMYLCYITMGDTADGYFGYFVKSNGNLISAHERPDEAYPGQHQRSRNGRWSDSKAYSIFPYEAFSFGDYDYKGYSHEHKIDDSKLRFVELSPESYIPVILSMVLLSNKFVGKPLDLPQTYIDSLMPVNLRQVESRGVDMVPYQSNALVQTLSSVNIDFSRDDVLSGAAGAEFDYDSNKDKPYLEKGHFKKQSGYAQMLVDMYGDDFELDTASLLRSDSCLAMLPEKSGETYTPEFVGSTARMRMEAYRQCRIQLANHIKQKLLEEYISFGGINAVTEWWRDAILKRKDVIEQICCQIYQKEDVAHWDKPKEPHPYLSGEVVDVEWNRSKYKKVAWQGIDVAVFPDTRYKIPELDYSTRFSLCTCDIDLRKDFGSDAQGKASLWFFIMPSNWRQLESLSQCEVPNLVKGWDLAEIPYAGNSILDSTDAVAEIEHPFNVMRRRSDDPYSKAGLGRYASFSVLVGFSKRRFKALLVEGEKSHEVV